MDNKYSVYRQIRYDRTYRTLGRMNWIRVVLGAVLLISIFFISGTVSRIFRVEGSYALAEKMMLAPAWMEKYKPETKAYLKPVHYMRAATTTRRVTRRSASTPESSPTARRRSTPRYARRCMSTSTRRGTPDALRN